MIHSINANVNPSMLVRPVKPKVGIWVLVTHDNSLHWVDEYDMLDDYDAYISFMREKHNKKE